MRALCRYILEFMISIVFLGFMRETQLLKIIKFGREYFNRLVK